MGPGGDLRHDAAVSGVAGDLAHHLIGENFAAVEAEPFLDDGDRRFVAGGFNAENAHASPVARES